MEAIKCEAAIMAAERGSLTAAASALGYTQSGDYAHDQQFGK